MKIHTLAAHYKASPEVLFNFLKKEENLPLWASKFCRRIDKNGNDYIITTLENQELYFKIDANADTGVIDMAAGPTKDQMWGGSQRVISDNNGGSVFIFTMLQAPGQAEEVFDAGCDNLEEEFDTLRKLID